MQLSWTIAELTVLLRRKLCDLYARIAQALPDLEAGSVDRTYALITLDSIRRLISLRRDLRP